MHKASQAICFSIGTRNSCESAWIGNVSAFFLEKEAFQKWLIRPRFKRQIHHAWKLVSLGGGLGELLFANGAQAEQVVVLPNGVDDLWLESPKTTQTKDNPVFSW